MKQQLIEKVREFRNVFGLKQGDEQPHINLFAKEKTEFNGNSAEVVDTYVGMVFASAGAIIDGFESFNRCLEFTIKRAELEGIDLPRAVDAVFAFNTSKLCSKSEIKPTADKYAAIGVAVHFEPVDGLDESEGFRCICTHTVTGDDGKEYPAGKLLKSAGV